MPTAREVVAQRLITSSVLATLGLPTDAVYQADTTDSPAGKPFIVIRWGEQETAMGANTVRPFDLWVYGEFGDYDVVQKMAKATVPILVGPLQIPLDDGGFLSQILDRGIGGDLADDGFDALVVPYHFAATGRGL